MNFFNRLFPRKKKTPPKIQRIYPVLSTKIDFCKCREIEIDRSVTGKYVCKECHKLINVVFDPADKGDILTPIKYIDSKKIINKGGFLKPRKSSKTV